jgi:hypothetical protein
VRLLRCGGRRGGRLPLERWTARDGRSGGSARPKQRRAWRPKAPVSRTLLLPTITEAGLSASPAASSVRAHRSATDAAAAIERTGDGVTVNKADVLGALLTAVNQAASKEAHESQTAGRRR